MPRKTLAKLESEIATLRELRDGYSKDLREVREKVSVAERAMREARAEHEDLKRRVLSLTEENNRMLGYIQRAQEDDVVREQLVPTGNEDNTTLVPKRKHTQFQNTNYRMDFLEGLHEQSTYVDGCNRRQQEELRKKGWVNY